MHDDDRLPVSRRSILGWALGAAAVAGPLASVLGPAGGAWAAPGSLRPTDPGAYVSFTPGAGAFPLVRAGQAVPLVVSDTDWPGVVRVAADLQADIEQVTGVRPAVITGKAPKAPQITIIGTIGRSPLIDGLIADGKLAVSGIQGAWETSLQTVVDKPFPGVDRAFVIAGSDQRGTIFGVYDVSRGIGVSPWHFWDDVQPVHRDALYVQPGRHTQGTPSVKYRGIFINDEDPALGTWAPAYFGPGKAPGHSGGFNAAFYAKVFELLLRLKANYLWPAVWGRAFAEDDPQNHATAKRYGIVMGTSHEAPMLRGIEEWNRHAVAAVRDSQGNIVKPGQDPYGGTGEWSFRYNAEALKKYWADGIKRMVEEDFEGVVTLGMRGNGDTALSDGAGIELMQSIISTQRQIIADVTGKDVTTIPQVWTMYKEVQEYWAQGMSAPDDVTIVFCDDNWSNVRKLPDPKGAPRSGGYGIYYHFDYVGVGRNYKWVDTANLANVWDQLNQCIAYGNHGLWVTNVGDLKGNERPTQFFLDYAWSPHRWTVDQLPEWDLQYARQNFDAKQAAAIAEVLATYGQLQARRKPELLNRRQTLNPAKDPASSGAVITNDKATPFSQTDYRELDRVTQEWQELAAKTDKITAKLPKSDQDTWFELIGYEVAATANLYLLRQAEFTNILYASQGRAATNDQADTAEARLADDIALADRFNKNVAGGKWQGFQTQTHIGYGDAARYSNAYWNDPPQPDQIYPALQRIALPAVAQMGVAIDGSDKWWPYEQGEAVLPTFSPYQSQAPQYIDIFNRGTTPFDYSIRTGVPWLTADRNGGRIDKETRVTLTVDWHRAPKGTTRIPITVTGPDGATVTVQAVVDYPKVRRSQLSGFVEANGYVSIEAAHYSRAIGGRGVTWQCIPRIGRTGDGMEPFPVTAAQQSPVGSGPRLEYEVSLFTTGPVTVWAYLSPRNPALPTSGLRYALSFDDAAPQIVDVIAATGPNDGTMNDAWRRNTSDNVNRTSTAHRIDRAGEHVLKFWMVDPTVVLQKLVIDTGGLKYSYLGPQESLRLH
ncbi:MULTISPECIES: glycosyl hydrolase 115 family protein [unclassified Streptomyces]|uniref:glycosyl hydrolase 115 family protein n=1 Tax=unclassified Streptomyces TaxID=2593676 RepID=UPI0029A6B1C6|nr:MULTISPECIES: glycosyl hydrolase 115 family protein [unclassified Streptomyces]MDX3772379.1 glycosyl hydrolase 115 family protein [Streptomyces sp. AK08-01B]MDX3821877.1 glycosyl hydrolase 115 family protein [Streptomyces sp. AK08-01A]